LATIEDVASRAGVSIATVSRVMNNSYIVSEEKREKVLAAARELQYLPSRNGPKRTENKIILVAGTSFIDDILAGMQDKAKECGYDIVFSYCVSRFADFQDMTMLNNGLADGLILLNMLTGEKELHAIGERFPTVLCGEFLDFPHSFSVSINEQKAAYEMVGHLLASGRRRIGLVLPNLGGVTHHFIREREKGYRLALAEAGIPYDPTLCLSGEFTMESGLEAGKNFLAMRPRPDAVFCATDSLAAGVMSAFQTAGLSIPADMAVAGFDNMEIAMVCHPPLTTVAQPFYEIGSESVRLLMTLIREDISVGRHVMIDHQIAVRGSTVTFPS